MSTSFNNPNSGYQPKSFQILDCTLFPVDGTSIDLRWMWNDLSVYEDIWSNGITAMMTVIDSQNLIKNLPIFGYETMNISFCTPNMEPFTHSFRIYRIENRSLIKDREQIYIIHMVSQEVFTDQLNRVSKSYKGVLISDIVQDLQNNYLASSFADIDATQYLHQIVLPNLHPMEAIRWLSTRANAASYPGSNYLYYENKDGYKFVTLEKLVQQVETAVYHVHPANLKNPYNDANVQNEIQINTEEYKFVNHLDTLQNQMNGMYASRLITHNINRKRFFTQDYSYTDSYPNFDHLEPNQAKNDITGQTGFTFLSDQEASLNSPSNLIRFFPSGLLTEDYPNQVEQWMQERISRLQQFHNIELQLTVAGDSRRKIGEKVEFILPSPEPLIDNQLQTDIYYRGAYLITGLRHLINRQEYVSLIELKKDSVFEPYP
jgi:hypothetical protein